jgi:hypothetical protein
LLELLCYKRSAPHKGQPINGILPGRYSVVPLFVGENFYISSVMLEGRDVAGRVVEFAAGAAPLQLTYKSGVGIVRGRVERGEGSLVILVPRDPGELTSVGTAR